MKQYTVVVPNKQRAKVGKLVRTPKVGPKVVVGNSQPWGLLQIEKKRLSKEAQYQKSKGKFRVTYSL